MKLGNKTSKHANKHKYTEMKDSTLWDSDGLSARGKR